MDDRGTPINKAPAIGNKDLDLYKLFKVSIYYCFNIYCRYFKTINKLSWIFVNKKIIDILIFFKGGT